MQRSFKKLVIGTVLVGAMAVGVAAVSAQAEESESAGGLLRTVVEIVVEETGLQPREILRQMNAGATAAEVIEDSGGSVDAVIDGTVAAISERVNARVADGTLTQDEADRFLSQLEERVTNRINGEGAVRRLVERRLRNGVLELAAEQTSLTREAIVTQVRDGASLAEVLSANGVDVNAFIDTFIAGLPERLPDARLEQLRERLAERINGVE